MRIAARIGGISGDGEYEGDANPGPKTMVTGDEIPMPEQGARTWTNGSPTKPKPKRVQTPNAEALNEATKANHAACAHACIYDVLFDKT